MQNYHTHNLSLRHCTYLLHILYTPIATTRYAYSHTPLSSSPNTHTILANIILYSIIFIIYSLYANCTLILLVLTCSHTGLAIFMANSRILLHLLIMADILRIAAIICVACSIRICNFIGILLLSIWYWCLGNWCIAIVHYDIQYDLSFSWIYVSNWLSIALPPIWDAQSPHFDNCVNSFQSAIEWMRSMSSRYQYCTTVLLLALISTGTSDLIDLLSMCISD